MSPSGRKPKPKALKLRDGTYRPSRERGAAPMPQVGIPEVPDGWRTAAPWRVAAGEELDRVAPLLEELGVLTTLDRAVLLGYCDAWGRVQHWTDEVARNGAVQVTKTGYEAARPAVSFLNRARADLRHFGALLGLSPAERERVARVGAPGRDPLEEQFFDAPKLVREE